MKKDGDFKKFLTPIIRLKPYVKAIWELDGKFTILLDDSQETESLKKALKLGMEKSLLKFENPKNLSLWWELVRLGESKTINELKNMNLIYDAADYVKLFKSMVEKESLFSTNKKADILFERARNHLNRSEEILLKEISKEIFNAMTETAQALLLYEGKFISEPEEILKALEKYSDFSVSYKEIFDEIKKIDSGDINEFQSHDAGYFISKAKSFLFDTEDMVANTEKDRGERMMYESYNFSLRLCEMALKMKLRILPLRDDEKLSLFKKNFVDNGKVDNLHYETLMGLYQFNKSSKREKIRMMHDKNLDKMRIKNLGLAVQNILRD